MQNTKSIFSLLLLMLCLGVCCGLAQEVKGENSSQEWRDVFFTSPKWELVYVNFILAGRPPCVLYLRPGDIISVETDVVRRKKFHFTFLYAGEKFLYSDSESVNGVSCSVFDLYCLPRAQAYRYSRCPVPTCKPIEIPGLQNMQILLFNWVQPGDLQFIPDLESFPNLIALDMFYCFGNVPLHMLTGLPHIQILSFPPMLEATAEDLNKFQQLRMLDLRPDSRNHEEGVTDDKITKLRLPHLRVLNLSNPLHVTNTEITDKGIEYVCQNFPKLEVLDIADTNLSEKSVAYLEKLQNLQVLNPCYVRPGLANLANLRILYGVHKTYFNNLKALKNLCVIDAEIKSDEDIALVKDFPQLRTFGKNENYYQRSYAALKITDEGLKSLQALPLLNTLNLHNNKNITSAGFQYLKSFKNLMVLDLGYTNIDDASLENIKDLTNLHYLDLSHTKITDAGLVHLANLTNLVQLDLSGTNITPKGLAHLTNLPNLRWLIVYDTDWNFRKAARNIPNLEIISWDGHRIDYIKK
jgi:hypothetical protein